MNILELLDRPIAFQRSFVRVTGSINAALMLSQAVYWSSRSTLPNGWFYKTRDEWEDETGLSRYEQESARKILVDKGLVSETKRGVPCKVHFQVNAEELTRQLGVLPPTVRGKTSHPVGGKPANKNVVFPPTITETTPETTPETTTETTAQSRGVTELARDFALLYPETTAGSETLAERERSFIREVKRLRTSSQSTDAWAEHILSRLKAYAGSVYVRTVDPRFIPLARNWLMGKKYNESDEAWAMPARKASALPFADFNEERAQLARII